MILISSAVSTQLALAIKYGRIAYPGRDGRVLRKQTFMHAEDQILLKTASAQ